MADQNNLATKPFLINQPVAGDLAAGGNLLEITYGPDANTEHYLNGVAWGMMTAPDPAVGGYLEITDNGVTVFKVYITQDGPGTIYFQSARGVAANHAMVVRLSATGVPLMTLAVLNHFARSV